MAAEATCAECGASLTPSAQWCSLCYAQIPARNTEVSTGEPGETPNVQRQQQQEPQQVIPNSRRPVDDMSKLGGVAEPVVGADPDEWAALLAAQEGSREPAYVQRFSKPKVRVLVGLGGAVALITVAFVAMVLLSRVVG